MNKRVFEDFFSTHDSTEIRKGVMTPVYRRPTPPPPPIPKEILTSIPDMDYESPIKIIHDAMQVQVENDIYKAVQNYDIKVDKDELIKALKYDREQYKKGFRDGVRKFVERWKEFSHSREVIWDLHAAMDMIAEELVGEGDEQT